MSKVITHTRIKIARLKRGEAVRTEHDNLTMGRTGYIPTGTNTAVNIKLAKERRGKYA